MECLKDFEPMQVVRLINLIAKYQNKVSGVDFQERYGLMPEQYKTLLTLSMPAMKYRAYLAAMNRKAIEHEVNDIVD